MPLDPKHATRAPLTSDLVAAALMLKRWAEERQEPPGWHIAGIGAVQAAPAAVAEPNTPFADQRVQIVYGLLADSEAMPPDGQHWEGWVARRIVDALAAAPAAAQPVAEPTLYVEVRECPDCGHIGVNDDNDDSACAYCDWSGPSPAEDHCPGCGRDGTMTTACPKCGHRTTLLAEAHLPVPAQHAAQPVAWRYVPSDAWRDFVLTGDPEKATLAREHGREVQGLYTTPPALVGLSDAQIEGGVAVLRPSRAGASAATFWFTNGARWAERALAAANGMTLREGGNG